MMQSLMRFAPLLWLVLYLGSIVFSIWYDSRTGITTVHDWCWYLVGGVFCLLPISLAISYYSSESNPRSK